MRKNGVFVYLRQEWLCLACKWYGKTVEDARKEVYSLVDKIVIPKKFYRTDIGEKFLKQERALLEKWDIFLRKLICQNNCGFCLQSLVPLLGGRAGSRYVFEQGWHFLSSH